MSKGIQNPRVQKRLCSCGLAVLLVVAAYRAAAAEDAAPLYPEHQDLGYYFDAQRAKHEIRTVADWEIRRRHILANMQSVMGPLPDRSRLEPLATRELESVKIGDVVRIKIEYATEPGYRLRAYLFLP